MLIAGIDPGRQHMGICVLEATSGEIVYWNVVSVDEKTSETFIDTFDPIFMESHIDECDCIYIERQPPKNSDMCKIQHYLEMFLALRVPRAHIQLVQPAKRVKFLRDAAGVRGLHLSFDTYAQRKKSSIAYVEHVLGECGSTPMIETFMTSSKKDDYAEAYILSHIHSN